MADDPFDVCECGDYRSSHVNGVGPCNLQELCSPSRCQRFRLATTAADLAIGEHEASEIIRSLGAGEAI